MKASSIDPDLTISPLQTVEVRLAKLEAKLDLFAQERLTKWDVCTVVFIILGALGAIITLAKFPFLQSSKSNMKRR
jgi:hypothetical protein